MCGHSVPSYLGWTIVSRLDDIKYVEELLNIQGVFEETEPDIAFSFRQRFCRGVLQSLRTFMQPNLLDDAHRDCKIGFAFLQLLNQFHQSTIRSYMTGVRVGTTAMEGRTPSLPLTPNLHRRCPYERLSKQK